METASAIEHVWWRTVHAPSTRSTLRIFGLHHSGGNGHFFDAWAEAMPEHTELLALQLPGRGPRQREPLVRRMDRLVDALLEEPDLYTEVPCVFVGHSMGAHVAFALATRLARMGAPLPRRLVVSAARPSHLPLLRVLHAMDDSTLVEQVRRMEGVPEPLLSDRAWLTHTLAVMRADFEVGETWCATDQTPLPLPLVALAGRADPFATPDEMERWKELTSRAFTLHAFTGGHFFISTVVPQVVALCHA